jgi:hypothetical protein
MAVPQSQGILKGLGMSQRRFMYGLDQTPDDRLEWSPGESNKPPLVVAGSLASFLTFIAHMLTHREMPGRQGEPPPPPASREAARQALEAGFSAVRHALEGLQEKDLAATMPAPWGEATVEEMLAAANSVVAYFQGQLNYIQLAYGDREPNIPKDWGHD